MRCASIAAVPSLPQQHHPIAARMQSYLAVRPPHHPGLRSPPSCVSRQKCVHGGVRGSKDLTHLATHAGSALRPTGCLLPAALQLAARPLPGSAACRRTVPPGVRLQGPARRAAGHQAEPVHCPGVEHAARHTRACNQRHRHEVGALTESMCWPQPAHVGFLHLGHSVL